MKATSITKFDLSQAYGISSAKLRRLLNVDYYDDLLLAGYKKHDSILPPKVVAKFVDCYGSPSDNSILSCND